MLSVSHTNAADHQCFIGFFKAQSVKIEYLQLTAMYIYI